MSCQNKMQLYLLSVLAVVYACTYGEVLYRTECKPSPKGYYCSEYYGCSANQLIICPIGNSCPEGSLMPVACANGTNGVKGLAECPDVLPANPDCPNDSQVLTKW